MPVAEVNAILAPYRLELTDNGVRVKSMDFEFGTVGVESIYEMMFLHGVSREQALQDVAMLLNVASPSKKSEPPKNSPPKKTRAKKVANA